MANEINKKLNRLDEKKIELKKELEKIERERERLIFEKREKLRKEAKPKRRNFIRELKQGGVSLAKIARETGISYYKARQIKLGKKILKSNTPEYRKLRNLHRRIGYQQLRAKGVSAKDAQRLRRDKLRLKPIFKKKKGRIGGYKKRVEAVIRLFNEVFIDKFTSKIRTKKDEELMDNDIKFQIINKYSYNAEFEIIKEEIIKIYDN